MYTWFYAEKSVLSPIITKAQQLPLANTIRNTMSRSAEMSGNIRPTDMAAVFAPNKQGNMAVFPMIWGFTVEQSSNRLSTAVSKQRTRSPYGKTLGSGGDVLFLHHGTTNGAYRPLKSATVTQMNSGTSKKKSMRYSRKVLRSHTLQDCTALRSIEVSRYLCLPC